LCTLCTRLLWHLKSKCQNLIFFLGIVVTNAYFRPFTAEMYAKRDREKAAKH
jgi:hypothetical protein